MSFRQYERYRDNGVAWLGHLPTHWSLKPFWALYRRTKRTGFPGEQLLSVYRDYGVIRKADRDDNFNNPSEDLSTYQLVEPTDLAMNKMKAWQGSLGVSQYRGIVSPAYFVFRSVHDDNPRYLHYLFRSPPYASAFMTISKGIRINQWDIDPQQLSQLLVPIPPLPEQAAIVDFLDRETGKIDALVQAQRRLIELLREKRQTVISQAVTKGLDPVVPMKGSGVEWLGEVPEHWSVAPLKCVATLQTGVAKGRDFSDRDSVPVPYLRVANVQDGYFDLNDISMIELPAQEIARYTLLPGDVLMNEGGDYDKLGRGGVWAGQIANCVHQNHVFAVRPFGVSSEWLNIITGAEYARFFFMGRSKQSTNLASISSTNLMQLPVTIPPRDEQAEILAYLDELVTGLDGLATEANSAIELLQERRAALISAAVTGRIDVRGWTASDVRKAVTAEIIYLHAQSPTFGRVKNQKLLYLLEVCAGISEIGGRYERWAAGPYDGDLISLVERELEAADVATVRQSDGRGMMVSYSINRGWKRDRARLESMLGDRLAAFDRINAKLTDLDTRAAEAVATLYAVWNDALIDGEACDDDRVIRGFLDEWHPEKREKFKEAELRVRLGWMRRNGLVPEGRGPRTVTGRLFA